MTDDDVVRILAGIWPDPAERQRAQAELSRYGTEAHEREVDRVRLAIVKLASGSVERLAEVVLAAK